MEFYKETKCLHCKMMSLDILSEAHYYRKMLIIQQIYKYGLSI